MVKKVKISTVMAIVIVILISIVSICVVNSTTVDNVEKFKVVESEHNRFLSWKPVRGAEGYNIYCSKNNGKYEKYSVLKDTKKTEFKLDELDSITKYGFKVSAYKEFAGKTYEGNKSEPLSLVTNPDDTVFVLAQSSVAGMASLEWEKVDCTGYEIQYSKEEFKDDTTSVIKIEKNDTVSYDIENLEKKATFNFRIRTYYVLNEKKYYSNWCETHSFEIKEASSKVDPSKPVVALTFDDGPNYSSTKRILDVLEKYDSRATFFMVGNRITGDCKKLVLREVEMGCQLGNHTYSHLHYGSNVTSSDITKCSKIIKELTGSNPTAFRCPGGSVTSLIRKNCKAPIYYWSIDTEDWRTKNAKSTYKAVMKNVKDGDIILMHDIYGTTADAVEKIVPALIKKGYQIVTVSELFEAKGIPLKNGHQYYSTTSEYNEY